MANLNLKECPSTIAIIGTGEYARAVCYRLHERGVKVVIGSRFPEKRKLLPKNDIFTKVPITSIQECVQSSDLVVVAINHKHYGTLAPLRPIMRGKLLVDVSNTERSGGKSNAEQLKNLFPECVVVKAFNTISAYDMWIDYKDRTAYVCGDDFMSRQIVKQLANMMGFSAVDAGPLASAAAVEESNRTLFKGWGWPSIVTSIVSLFWTLYTLLLYYVKKNAAWEKLPLTMFNKITGCNSITLLALCFIPGPIAACKQLATGTKHKRFHKSFDTFLKMRKQLGLYALLFGLLHCMFSVILLNSSGYRQWYESSKFTIPANQTEDLSISIDTTLDWEGELMVMLGMVGIFMMAILGIGSMPGVVDSLNWREFQCVQSWMGLVCLLFSIAHVNVKGALCWVHQDARQIMSSMTMISLLLAWFALLLRLFLLLPCVYTRVRKIRQGWVRGESKHVEVLVENGTLTDSIHYAISNGTTNTGFNEKISNGFTNDKSISEFNFLESPQETGNINDSTGF